MAEDKSILKKTINPGYNIVQGRGGQGMVMDNTGNTFIFGSNKSGSQSTNIDLNEAVSGIFIQSGKPDEIVKSNLSFSSKNFNTVNNQPENIGTKKVIQPQRQTTTTASFEAANDILPPTSSTTTNKIDEREIVLKNQAITSLDTQSLFLPAVEPILQKQYDSTVEGIPLKLPAGLSPGLQSLDIRGDGSGVIGNFSSLGDGYSTYNDNNPFNMINTDSAWQGKTGSKIADNSGLSFVVFDKIENGVRAGLMNLTGYFTRKNLNTIKQIINVYAPPGSAGQSSEATSQYVKTATTYMQQNWDKNVKSTDLLQFKGANETNKRNIKMFKTLAKAIVKVEGLKNSSEVNPIIDNFDIKNLRSK